MDGVALVRMMELMIEWGCEGCGSCEVGNGKNRGLLKVDYVAESQCIGLCVYQSSAERKPVSAWRPGEGVVLVE